MLTGITRTSLTGGDAHRGWFFVGRTAAHFLAYHESGGLSKSRKARGVLTYVKDITVQGSITVHGLGHNDTH